MSYYCSKCGVDGHNQCGCFDIVVVRNLLSGREQRIASPPIQAARIVKKCHERGIPVEDYYRC